jgi:phage terminase Nu1 subunit (DNA packaging protein)
VTLHGEQKTLASLGQCQLAGRSLKQPDTEIALQYRQLRLTAAGVSESLRAATEKLLASALRTKDSRLARVSTAFLQVMLVRITNHCRLILGQ